MLCERLTTYLGVAAWVVVVLLAGSVPPAAAHGGGLDDRGCHNSSASGRYHCHQGPHAGQSYPSESAVGSVSSPNSGSGSSGGDYERDAYGDWRDLDGDCQDARDEALIRHAERYQLGPRGCEVVAGVWIGPYTGRRLTDPSGVHIDHIVPLKEGHISGAARWSSRRKQRFANDPDNVLPVEAGANMSKGADDPAEWLPERGRCAYVERWVRIKHEYDLSADAAEQRAIARVQRACR